MARKKPVPAKIESQLTPDTDPPGSVATPSVGGVEFRPFEGARRLITIEAESPLWAELADETTRTFPRVDGAIVRLRPGSDVSDEELEGMVLLCKLRGAVRVTTLPRPKGALVPEKLAAAPAERHVGARQAVLVLVDGVNTKDRPRLRSLVEEIMAKEGL